MPIKPENRGLYPENWGEIRAAILERAGHKCEWCKVPDKATVMRFTDPQYAGMWATEDGQVYDATGAWVTLIRASESPDYREVYIVLTVAHLDHDPANCVDDNLKALCQRCHLRYDAQHHAANAKATRHKRKYANQTSLLEGL